MKIDLNSKPQGATHINPHTGMWIKCFGGNSGSYQFFKGGQWEMGFGCMSNAYLEIAKPEPWSGEGLPPVGTVCEYKSYQLRSEWKEVEIIAHFMNKVMVAAFIKTGDGGKIVDQAIAECFRPIRTAEQIAAEDREKAIDEMVKDFGTYFSNPRVSARTIYDAGYRKQVQP